MSQQLTISSLISAFALVTLALFARAGDMTTDLAGAPVGSSALVQAEAPSNLGA